MFKTTVGNHRLERDDVELTQQFPPIFQSLLSAALDGGNGVDDEEDFRRDPLAAPLPTQLSSSPAESAPPSTLDAALLGALPDAESSRARLRAVPAAGGAHRAEVAGAGSRAGRRAVRVGAHRAPEAEPRQPTDDRPANSRGGRHRTLRAVAH